MLRVALVMGTAMLTSVAAGAPTANVVFSFKQPIGDYPFPAPLEHGRNYLISLPYGGIAGCRTSFFECGTVLRLSPPDTQHATWRGKPIYRFLPNGDGYQPNDSPVPGKNGELYLTTSRGGAHGNGTLVELSPPGAGSSNWTEQVIHSFDFNADGSFPIDRPRIDSSGNLYVTTEYGSDGSNSYGSVLELSPPAAGKTMWTENVLHKFISEPDGLYPISGVKADDQGNLYLATYGGGSIGAGTVVQLSPPSGGGTSWTETVLYQFQNGPNDGAEPQSGLLLDTAGNLYGTTSGGGINNNGIVYELSPPAGGGTTWTETVIYRFTGGADGITPGRGIVRDAAGNLFVATSGGTSACGCGSLVELAPPAAGQTQWTETTLYQFAGGISGAGPSSIAVEDNGNLLIPTFQGGTYNRGTLMQFSNTGYVVSK